MEWAVPFGVGLALADSPVLPFGDAAGGALIGLAKIYDTLENRQPFFNSEESENGNTCDDKYAGYREGMPEVLEGSKLMHPGPKPPPKSKSQNFRDFLASKDISKKGWHYHMEVWRTPDGKYIPRHYWRQKGTGRTFYHLRPK